MEHPVPLGERCGRCLRWLNPGFPAFRDKRLGTHFCSKCVRELVDEKLGLVFVVPARPRPKAVYP